MGFYDFINFVVSDNPISKSVTSLVIQNKKPLPEVKIVAEQLPLWKLANESGPFIRVAALMGASAVALGAYGAHRTYPKDTAPELKTIFETANRYHFFHALALMGVPLCRNPKLAGAFMISGTIIFSGSLYYHALTGENKFGQFAPIGGTMLILGWLSMALMSPNLLLKPVPKL